MFSPTSKPPLANWMLVLLCAVYLLAGTIGHDPWKIDDAIHIGIAWEFAAHGDWLNPRVGAEPLSGVAPLYHWCAALLGNALSIALPFHDGARLASALFGGLFFYGLALAARTLALRNEVTGLAPVLAIGTLGLVQPVHDAQPAVALLAAQALVYAGIATTRRQPKSGALLAATAIAVGFWSNGAISFLVLLPPYLLPVLHADWRTLRSMVSVIAGLMLGIGVGALWPLLLYLQSPEQLLLWQSAELARFNIFRAGEYQLRDHFELLSWFVWPILPIALWSLWIKRRALSDPSTLLPLTGCLFAFAEFFLIADPKPLLSLPMIVPLVLLALPGAERLRRGATNAFDWFGIMTFTMIAGLLWLGGIAIATGEPVRVAKNFYKAEPGFAGHLSVPAFIVAGLMTAAWLWIIFRMPRSPWRSAIRWAAGVALMWGLMATLWLPWVDFGKTYRPVANSLAKILGANQTCISSKDVGLAQKASLRYFIGLSTRPIEHGADNDETCPLLLIQGATGSEPELKGMKKIWEGNRGGDKSERLRLYRRVR